MLSELLVVALLVSAGSPAIEGVYPDPITSQDRGEFIVVSVPKENGNLSVTDGETTVSLSNISTTGQVVITDDPGPANNVTSHEIYEVEDFLSLANSGETVTLKAANQTVDTLTYPRATEGELYRNGSFTPLGRSSFDPMRTERVSHTSFLLPDRPSPISATIRNATDRIRLAGYTFTDSSTADALIRAHQQNVSVTVLVEGGPVGGISHEQVRQLDRIQAAGIEVLAMGTARARYRYHHAKYAVVDDTTIVTSENWKPSGVGGNGSRGWGVVIENESVATDLARVFAADTTGVDAMNWSAATPAEPVETEPANGSYPDRFEPQRSVAESVTVLVAPDNAGSHIETAIDQADESIRVQQVSVDPRGPLINATVAAAARGVSVRILLSSEWYVIDENRKIAERLRSEATRRDLPLEVRLAEPRSRYEHIHAKGLLVDGESTFLGSLNWNANARLDNREVLVRIDDPNTATLFQRAFRADWRGAAWRVSWLVLGAVATVVAGAGWFARTYTDFEEGSVGWEPP